MTYQIHAGILYAVPKKQSEVEKLAIIQEPIYRARKKIRSLRDGRQFSVDIQYDNSSVPSQKKKYVLTDENAAIQLSGIPCRTDEKDTFSKISPSPACQILPANQLFVEDCQKKLYILRRENSQTYHMADASGQIVFKLIHQGMAGGWELQSRLAWEPAQILGLFVFCRYLDQENEFPILNEANE